MHSIHGHLLRVHWMPGFLADRDRVVGKDYLGASERGESRGLLRNEK